MVVEVQTAWTISQFEQTGWEDRTGLGRQSHTKGNIFWWVRAAIVWVWGEIQTNRWLFMNKIGDCMNKRMDMLYWSKVTYYCLDHNNSFDFLCYRKIFLIRIVLWLPFYWENRKYCWITIVFQYPTIFQYFHSREDVNILLWQYDIFITVQ